MHHSAPLLPLLAILFTSLQSAIPVPAEAAAAKLTTGEHIAHVNGVDLHYFVSGSGPLLVVQAPGWGLGSEYLRKGLSPLQKHFTMVFYDTRGSGLSGRPQVSGHLHTSDMVDDLEGLRRVWGLPAITLLGHSHGGAIALGYAIRYPQRVQTLILVDAGILDFDFAPSIAAQLAARKDDARFASAIAHLNAPGQIDTDEALQQFLGQIWPLYFHDPERYASAFTRTLSTPPSAWVFNQHPEADRSLQEDGAMGSVTARTLVLAGRDDWVCGPTIAERIHSGIPRSQLRLLDNAGHFPWIEVPAEFFAAVTRFAGE